MTKPIIFAGLLVFSMGQTVLFALMGPVARDIGLAEWQVGAIISSAAIVFVFISPIWGKISDRWGRKNVIVTGLFGYAAATFLFAGLLQIGLRGFIGASVTFGLLLASRLLYSLLSGGIQPAAVALMADLTDNEDRSAGIAAIGAAFGLGSVLGPALAAGLVGFGILVPLIFAAAMAMLIALIAIPVVKEPVKSDDGSDNGDVKLDPKAIAPFLLLSFGIFVAISTLQQTTSFYVQDFTGTESQEAARLAGFAFMALAIAMLIVQGAIVQIMKPKPPLMLGLGLPIAAIGVVVYLTAPSFALLISGFAIMGAGFGLVQPGISAYVSLQTGAEQQGAAAGYVQAAMAGGFVIGPLAGTALYGYSPSAPLTLALSATVICLLLFVYLHFKSKREK
ncbi:MAG: MFS transporter [Pseudomonadota bacterium]